MRVQDAMTDVRRAVALAELDEMRQLAALAALPSAAQREHPKRFDTWVRSSAIDQQAAMDLKAFEHEHHIEAKDVLIGTGAAGGFAVPEEISREIERMAKAYSPVRDLVRVIPISSSDYTDLVNIRGMTAAWTSAGGIRTLGGTPQFRARVPALGETYCYVEASAWAIDDIAFDVGAWLAEEAAQAFAEAEGLAVISGDGSSKPTGILASAPVSTADFASPLRDPGPTSSLRPI
jgi:HK97 family phage major capsid protein